MIPDSAWRHLESQADNPLRRWERYARRRFWLQKIFACTSSWLRARKTLRETREAFAEGLTQTQELVYGSTLPRCRDDAGHAARRVEEIQGAKPPSSGVRRVLGARAWRDAGARSPGRAAPEQERRPAFRGVLRPLLY